MTRSTTFKRRKPNYKKCVRVNITLPPTLIAASETIIQRHGFSGLSDYFQCRLRQDAGLELTAQ
jgi:hypothetical protein